MVLSNTNGGLVLLVLVNPKKSGKIFPNITRNKPTNGGTITTTKTSLLSKNGNQKTNAPHPNSKFGAIVIHSQLKSKEVSFKDSDLKRSSSPPTTQFGIVFPTRMTTSHLNAVLKSFNSANQAINQPSPRDLTSLLKPSMTFYNQSILTLFSKRIHSTPSTGALSSLTVIYLICISPPSIRLRRLSTPRGPNW